MYPQRVSNMVSLWKSQIPASPFYAVKCNPDAALLHLLYDRGVGFDCASEKELLDVQALSREGMKDKIVYANPCKSGRDLRAAKELGSPLTVVDSREEVEKLKILEYSGEALVRIAVPDSGSLMPFSTKFGCLPASVPVIANAARALGISLKGISFHVGSGCMDQQAYKKAIELSIQSVLKLKEAGHDASVIDLGGGYLPSESDFRWKAIQIRSAIFNGDYDKKYKFIAEPGRFFASNSMDFFVQVIAKRHDPKTGAYLYTVDDSLYGQFSSILFDHATPKWVRVRGPKEPVRPFSSGVLFGKTCDSVDVIARAHMEELEVGDWLLFPNMGAYTRATASEFNGFPKPGVVSAAPGEVGDFFWSDIDFKLAEPKNIRYMPPVSSKAFWS
jgi:ornithine decarboxylase